MALITHAYFDEGDFSKVSLLEDTYHHLNSVLLQNDLSAQTFVGALILHNAVIKENNIKQLYCRFIAKRFYIAMEA